MSDVRLLEGDDFAAFVTIAANAYPSFDFPSAESRQEFAESLQKDQREHPTANMYGLFRDGQLLGGMRLHDFTMNTFGTPIPVGGVGFVAVDIAHKKEKVAKEMIEFFVRHYREQGAPLTSLYPFRPDFYKQMGFGYGAKVNQYRFKPGQLPRNGARQRVRLLSADDIPAMLACYTRVFEHTHGLFAKIERDFTRVFEGYTNRIVGYVQDDAVQGYSIFRFNKGPSPLINDIEIGDCVYENREALAGLLAFFQSQADQVRSITFNSQDALFHQLLLDPRSGGDMYVTHVANESNTAGVSIMYRVVDTADLFKNLSKHSFGDQNCTLRLTIRDDFLPENDGSILVRFDEGRATVQSGREAEAEVQLRIDSFSSLVMGVISFSQLHMYSLAEISDAAYIPLVDKLFMTATPPICMTRF